MGEKKDHLTLPYGLPDFLVKIKFPDGSYMKGIDVKTGKEVILERRIDEDGVKRMEGLGYELEPVIKETGRDWTV